MRQKSATAGGVLNVFSILLLLVLYGGVAVLGRVPSAQARPIASMAERADMTGLAVALGYADSLRANPTHFPSPWAGSPHILFEGCQPAANCTYDGGAIEIVNNGVDSHTINTVIVKLGTCQYSIWPTNTSLPAGDALILAQMVSGATSGCTTDGRFDTSDVGPNGASWSGVCTQSGIHPEVDVTIDGTLQTFADNGQILNTKGVDAAECGVGNESTQWTPIGNVGCPTATLSLTPATQDDSIGTRATVTATLDNTCGNPLQNVAVDFRVTAGPNAGLTGTGTTDANGDATFSYVGATLGTDTIDASVSNLAGTIASSGAVTVTWGGPVSLAVKQTTADYDDQGQVTATLTTASGATVAGAAITFQVGDQTCGPATTSSAGVATCALTPTQPAGSYPIVARFAGTSAYGHTQGNGTFTVIHEETTTHYTGQTQLTQGQPAILKGTLLEDGRTPIAGRTLTLSDGAESCTGTTDATGNAQCATASISVPPGTALLLSASFTGDAYYMVSSGNQPGVVVASGRSGDGSTSGPQTAQGNAADGGTGALAGGGAQGLGAMVAVPLFGSFPLWLVVVLAILIFGLLGSGALYLVRSGKIRIGKLDQN